MLSIHLNNNKTPVGNNLPKLVKHICICEALWESSCWVGSVRNWNDSDPNKKEFSLIYLKQVLTSRWNLLIFLCLPTSSCPLWSISSKPNPVYNIYFFWTMLFLFPTPFISSSVITSSYCCFDLLCKLPLNWQCSWPVELGGWGKNEEFHSLYHSIPAQQPQPPEVGSVSGVHIIMRWGD